MANLPLPKDGGEHWPRPDSGQGIDEDEMGDKFGQGLIPELLCSLDG
jgi:hypothetical protein